MNSTEAILISQIPLVVMAVFFYMEFRRMRQALEKISQKMGERK